MIHMAFNEYDEDYRLPSKSNITMVITLKFMNYNKILIQHIPVALVELSHSI